MFFRKRFKEKGAGPETGAKDNPAAKTDLAPNLSIRELARTAKPIRRTFPGPRSAAALLRVAVEGRAHADFIAHAKESLDVEVCGVLVGQVCEDDAGVFVHVEAAIRGAAASQGSTHVTFTQATWSAIHQTLEHDFPKLRIVGWYHTHPGFGVEFSEMDLFIHKNFFSGPGQIALVTDPLSGALAVCVNTEEGIEYLPRLSVEGREQTCRVPAGKTAATGGGAGAAAPAGDLAQTVKDLESRITQLVQAMDEQRAQLHSFLLFVGAVFCLALIAVAGYSIYLQFKARVEPPKNIGYAEIPVVISNQTALLGVQVVSWKLPPEMDVMRQAVEQAKRELAKMILQSVTNAGAELSNAPAPANGPAPEPKPRSP